MGQRFPFSVFGGSRSGAGSSSTDASGRPSASGLKPGTSASLFNVTAGGSAIETVTVDAQGKATFTTVKAPGQSYVIDGTARLDAGPGQIVAPAAPTVTLTSGNGQVSIAWADGATGGSAITSHGLYRGTVSGNLQLVGFISTGSPYVDTGLTNGTAYIYQLSAKNGVGESVRSAEATTTPAAMLPTLPALSAAPRMAIGTTKLVSAYAGPAVRVQRVSDSVAQDIGFTSMGLLDLAAARTFAGTQTLGPGLLSVLTVYDQSGNGNHATSTTNPWLVSERDAYGPNFADRAVIAIASQKYAFTNVSQVAKTIIFPTTFSNPSQDYAVLLVTTPLVSYQNNALLLLGSVTGATRNNIFTDKSSGLQCGSVRGGSFGGSQAPTSMQPRLNAQVIKAVSRSTGKVVTMEDVSTSFAAEDAQTFTGGGLGPTGAGAAYSSNQDFHAFVAYPAVPDAEVAQANAVLSSNYVTAKANTLLYLADSSTPEGVGSINNRSYARMVQGYLTGKLDIINGSCSGNTLTNARDTGAAKVDPTLRAGKTNYYCPDSGSNDLLNYTSGTASTDAASVYAILKQICQARIAAGWKIIVTTISPRSDYTAYQEQVRLAYNTLVRNGQSDLGYSGIFDRANVPLAQTAASPNYQQETTGAYIHPTDPLQVAYAQAFANVLQPLLQ